MERYRWLSLLGVCGALQATGAYAQELVFANGFEPFTCAPQIDLIRGQPTSWQALFGTPFPSASGTPRGLGIARGHYVALEFVTTAQGTMPPSGAVTSSELFGGGAGAGLMTISRCPGDFADNLSFFCRSQLFANPSLGWRTTPGPKACVLEPNTLYYVNITFGSNDAPSGNQPWCAASVCNRAYQSEW